MFRKVNVPILGVVENQSYYVCPSCGDHAHVFGHGGAAKVAEELGVTFLGEVRTAVFDQRHGAVFYHHHGALFYHHRGALFYHHHGVVFYHHHGAVFYHHHGAVC